jgi:hypothetical protein
MLCVSLPTCVSRAQLPRVTPHNYCPEIKVKLLYTGGGYSPRTHTGVYPVTWRVFVYLPTEARDLGVGGGGGVGG